MKRKLSPWCKEAKKALIDRDLSVTDLSTAIGVGRTYVSGVLNGRLLVPEVADKISKELELNVNYNN